MKWSMEGFIRGSVKIVFLLCYIAFMYASIQHVATFFANFEANSTTDFSSYLLATAFDLTALVVTTALMFFRKSMPGYVQVIVWGFVAFITLFSWYMNWVYAHHYQNLSLISSVTYSQVIIQGKTYYTAIPQANSVLAHIDPIIASSFTALNIVFTVVSEFFGTKPPTAAELQAKIDYQNSVAGLKKQLADLQEEKANVVDGTFETAKKFKEKLSELTGNPKDSTSESLAKLMDFYRDTPQLLTDEQYANVTHSTIKKMLKLRDINEAITWKAKVVSALQKESNEAAKPESNSDETSVQTEEVCTEQTEKIAEEMQAPKPEECSEMVEENAAFKPDVEELVNRYPKIAQILTTSGSTISIVDAAALSGYGVRALTNKVEKGLIKTTPRSKQILFKKDFLQWLKTAQPPRQNERKTTVLHVVDTDKLDPINDEQTENKFDEREVDTNPELMAIG